MKNWIIIFTIFFGTSLPAHAAGPTGRDIALKMDRVDSSRDIQAKAIMVIERHDKRLTRKMEIYGKKYGAEEKRLITFIEPADVNGTMYLTWSYPDQKREDDMWIFLPAESLVRRISGGGKKGSFMRSDISNEDIEVREVDDDVHELMGFELFSGIDCWVLKSEPINRKDTNYSKRILWISKETYLPVKIEFFNHKGKHFKTGIFGGFKEIKGIWTITKMMFETPSRGSKTLMQYTDYEYNLGLSDSLFEKSILKR